MDLNEKPKTLGLAVYIPLILAIFFLFLAFAAGNNSALYVFGFIPNPFYTSDPTSLTWNFPGLIFIVTFGLLGIACLLITVAMVTLRADKAVLNKGGKPTSRKANIIATILIFLVIFIVWYIYKFGVH